MKIAKFLPIYFSGYKTIIVASPALLLPMLITASKLQTGKISKRFIIPCMMFIFLMAQWLILDISIVNELARLIPPLLLFSISKSIRVSLEEICQVIFYLVVIDTIYRFALHPNILFISPVSDLIYSVKNTTTIFFFDSNLTAIYAFFALIFIKKSLMKIILMICIYYAFSRAVYAMLLIFFLLMLLPEISQRGRKVLALISVPALIYSLSFLLGLLAEDGSGRTKILIMEKAFEFLKSNWLLGLGSGEFKNNFILASHTLIGQLGELGIIGITIISLPLLYFLFYSRRKTTYSITAVTIIGGIFGLYPIAYMGFIFLMLDRFEQNDL